MNASNSAFSSQRRKQDLLPNEQEVSYERLHGFFPRYKFWIGAASVFVILAAAGYIAWCLQENHIRRQSGLKLAQARTIEDFKSVIHDFPGTNAALLATLRLADMYYEQQKWEDAKNTYQEAIKNFALSELVPSALIGEAAVFENTGNFTDALKIYKLVASDYSKSFQGPQAKFAAARLLETTGQLEEARTTYEDLIALYPKSIWKQDAMDRLQKLSLLIKNTQPAATPSNPPIPKVLENIPKKISSSK